ncbi:lanthionine synthetase C family protein [Aquimarina sp. D1M17]|uniref:lanthionine synthetase C family protein n=1 Tax=Aquimarina acroporae TaxID=2937283 RepID=UPI0020C0AD1E|nr:lanthionine synthetase C family protein [Aquimarina acroporae]MCK8524164.1 lanthionine synthetase C family protein [Aquimarina acroporae]
MSLEVRLNQKLEEIHSILEEKYLENKQIGVLSGISGISLFQFYYSKFKDNDEYADKAAETITKALESINEGYVYPTFCDGIAGAAWVVEILKEEEFIELDDDFLSSGIDEYLVRMMKSDIEEGNFDFLHGALGYGYYFYKRYLKTTSNDLKIGYKKHLDYLINCLKETAKSHSNGIWWESVLKREEGLKGCNLSLSHGMSSTINFLARLAEHDDFKEDIIGLIRQASYYLTSCKNTDSSLTASFPNWVLNEQPENGGSRLAWCYGDLGIGMSLLRAAEVLEDKELYQNALEVLLRSTKRTDIKEAGVVDAGLCHGSYGILQIYNHLFKKTKHKDFKDAADFWIKEAISMDFHKDGYAGYMLWRGGGEDKVTWKPEINLLEGIAGIGLSILSYLDPFETKWDECLMIG